MSTLSTPVLLVKHFQRHHRDLGVGGEEEIYIYTEGGQCQQHWCGTAPRVTPLTPPHPARLPPSPLLLLRHFQHNHRDEGVGHFAGGCRHQHWCGGQREAGALLLQGVAWKMTNTQDNLKPTYINVAIFFCSLSDLALTRTPTQTPTSTSTPAQTPTLIHANLYNEQIGQFLFPVFIMWFFRNAVFCVVGFRPPE